MASGKKRRTKKTRQWRPRTEIGENLRRLRLHFGMSQGQLAAAAGVSQPTVQRIEAEDTTQTEDPGAVTLKKFADVFGISVLEFWRMPVQDEETLQAFLTSPFATDVTRQEQAMLRAIGWPGVTPTVKSWSHALDAIRAARHAPSAEELAPAVLHDRRH